MSDEKPMTAAEELEALDRQEAEEARLAKVGKAEADAALELANRKVIRDYKAKNPGVEVRRIDTEGGMVLIRRPSPEQYRAFQRTSAAGDPESLMNGNAVLAAAGVVHPPEAEWDDLCVRYVALRNSIAMRVIEFSGSDTTVKKV